MINTHKPRGADYDRFRATKAVRMAIAREIAKGVNVPDDVVEARLKLDEAERDYRLALRKAATEGQF